MNMLDYLKAALLSKTMWGIFITAIPPVSKALGHEIAPADATGLVNAAQMAISTALTVGGTVLAIWGRTGAKGPLVVPKA
jgi:hypothetical protein